MRNRLLPTAEDSVGPYYAPAFLADDRQDLTVRKGFVIAPAGERIVIRGRLMGSDGQPVFPILAEIWQADANGHRRTHGTRADDKLDPWFEGHSRHYCADGTFVLRTVKPGVDPETGRAPFFTVNLFCDGTERLVTQFFLDGESANATDPLLTSLPVDLAQRLIARRVDAEADGTAAYEITIILRGEGETPFFDDQFS